MYDSTKTEAINTTSLEPQGVEAASLRAPSDDGELCYLPLSALDFDTDNVRKRGVGNVDELKALIASQGLMQNLTVCPLTTKRGKVTGKYGVVAGGRRLRALRALADEGKIAKDYEVLVRIKAREQALMASIAENSGREPMSGADTLVAFADMVRQGKTTEELAASFGISVLTVQRRLKLANVSPKLFELYAEDKINIEQLMALAVIDDHARQEAAWKNAPSWNRDAGSLRRLALGDAVNAATDKLAKFVGLAAYKAAGGQVHGDLFSDDDKGYIADPVLLNRLADEKLGAKREKLLAAGAAWVEVVPTFDYSERQKYVEPPKSMREPTKAEKKKLDAARADAAQAERDLREYEQSEGEGDEDLYETLSTASDKADGALAELQAALETVSPDVEALCGVVLCIEHNGQLKSYPKLLRKQDVKQATAIARGTSVTEDGASAAPAGAEPEAGLSEALLGRLAAQRSVALQVEVAKNHQVALAVLVATLLPALSVRMPVYPFSSITARSRQADLKMADASIESSKAWGDLQALCEATDAGMPRGDDLLPWLIAQPVDALVKTLALLSAKSIYAGAGSLRRARVDVVADAVGLDMTHYWTANGDTYFKSVPKALIAEAIATVDADKAKSVDKLKKGEAVALAEATLQGSNWLPVQLRRVTGE